MRKYNISDWDVCNILSAVFFFLQQLLPQHSTVFTSKEISIQRGARDNSAYGQLNVTLLADEWGSKKGGLSTMNRELATNLANLREVKVKVTFFVPKFSCSIGEKKEAEARNVDIVEAKKRPDMDDLDWLCFPTRDLKIDVVVGHGVKLGQQAQIIRESHHCKWLQVLHTAPKELSVYKEYNKAISKGERKNQTEIELCKHADLGMAIGPKLKGIYSDRLRGCGKEKNVFEFTPGIIGELTDSQPAPKGSDQFKVLVFGRTDREDFKLKGYDIAAEAFAHYELKGKRYCLVFVGASDEKLDEVTQRLLEFGISKKQLDVRPFIESRQGLKELFREVDLAMMPSRTEGFGLAALEALSAGLPILVCGNSGFADALSKVPFGGSYIVDSEDPKVWAEAIKAVQEKDRAQRLQEIKKLRASYEKKYSWKKQCGILANTMWNMVHGKNVVLFKEVLSRNLRHPCFFSVSV